MATPLISFLQSFGPISKSDQQLISAAFKPRVYNEGDALFSGGGICRELFFVCKGVLRIMVATEDGKQVTHYFLRENQFCAILNSFNNQVPANESIQAACQAEVLAISRANLYELYIQLPQLKTRMDQIIQQGLLNKIQLRNMYLGHNAATRYQLFLTHQADVAARVSVSDIASYLGITLQSLSRIRKSVR